MLKNKAALVPFHFVGGKYRAGCRILPRPAAVFAAVRRVSPRRIIPAV